MSTKIQNPNQKGHGFLIGVIAIVVIIVALIAYVVISNNRSTNEAMFADQQDVNFNISWQDDAVVLRGEGATDDTPQVDLYSDYSCPHCHELAEATDDEMLQAVENGELIVNIRTLNFLDRGTDGHSTHAGAAALAVAQSGDAHAYWNFYKFLLEQQTTIYGRYSDDDFANAAARFGADDEVQEAIRSGAVYDAFVESADFNTNKLRDETGQVSSPRIIQNGRDIQVDNWVEDAVNGINYTS